MNEEQLQAMNKIFVVHIITKKLPMATMEQLVQIGKILKI